MFTGGTFFIEFPFLCACLITAVMAADRVFVITLPQKYEDIVTLKTLKVISIILILFCVTFSSITAWGMHNMMLGNNFWVFYLGIPDLILKVIPLVVVITAHLYILNFVLKRWDLKQLRIHHHKNQNTKRLTKTIICICISQLIFTLPYLSHRLFLMIISTADSASFAAFHVNINASLKLLRYCQCFSNAIIILLNQKKQKISKPIYRQQPSRNDKSRMETRFWNLKDLE